MEDQDDWRSHALFMNDLVASGFVSRGGPLADGEEILLLVHAENETEIIARLEEDPWTAMGLLEIASIKRWRTRLGIEA
jgi:uncharacterized protein YciI